MKPILFLDFDGVLNDTRYLNSDTAWRERKLARARNQDLLLHALDLDPRRIEVLNDIVRRTGAMVVVHSSWRLSHDADELFDMLKLRGFRGVMGGVCDPQIRDRADAIRAFLDDLGPARRSLRFAVVDDEDLRDEPIVGPRFVLTGMHPEDAFGARHVERLVELLVG